MRKSLSRRQTPVAFVQAILRAYADRGMDAGPALAAAGLGPADLADPQAVLPQGLALSVVGVLTTAIAGWHGGKLIFDHGIGLMVSPKD